MKLSIELLISRLLEDNEDIKIGVYVPLTIDITKRKASRIEWFTRSIRVPDEDVLWFGTVSTLLDVPVQRLQNLTVFVSGEEPRLNEFFARNNCVCIYTPDEEMLYQAFNTLLHYFSELARWDSDTDLAIANREPLQKIIELSEKVVQNPMIAWDGRFTIVAHPTFRLEDIPTVQGWIDAGQIPGEDVAELARRGYLKRTPEFYSMQQCTSYLMSNPFAIRIFEAKNRQTLVLIQYYTVKPPSLAQSELLSLLEEKVARYMSDVMHGGYRPKNYLYAPFLIDLINGALTDKAAIMDRLKYINMPMCAHYRLYEIACESYVEPVITSIKATVKSLFYLSHAVEYRQHVYVLDRDESLRDEDQRWKTIKELCENFSCYCGVSTPVEDLTGVHLAAEQCSAALRVGYLAPNGKRVFRYSDVYFYDMMLTYYEHMSGDFSSILLPNLVNLVENDRKCKNDNLRLLSIYLSCDRNITSTAKKMFLHRNSVIYRINRIEQILGLSLDDPKVRFDLQVSLRCLELKRLMMNGEDAFSDNSEEDC